jgi:asparagine synthase (glutamine-hydrolysing)
MEFAATLPAEMKLRGASGKVLLKSTLRGVLPNDVLNRPKMGFGVPLARWFRTELRDLPGEMLLGADSRVHRYVKPQGIELMIKQHHDASVDHSLRLWVLLQLELWHREVVESPRAECLPAARVAGRMEHR